MCPRLAKKASYQKGVGWLKTIFTRVRHRLVDARNILIAAAGDGGGGRVGGIFPGKDDVIGGEGRAIVPDHPPFQPPGDRSALRRQAAVRQTGDLLRQDRHEFALPVEARQRLVDHARRINVFEATRQMRVQDRRGLPPQQSQFASTPASGGGKRRGLSLTIRHHSGCRLGRQQLCCHWTRQAQAEHRAHELPTTRLPTGHRAESTGVKRVPRWARLTSSE